MNKTELINRVAAETSLPKADVRRAVDAVFETIASTLAGEGKVTIPGFGTFVASMKQSRSGVNPRTMERIEIPGHLAVRFKAERN